MRLFISLVLILLAGDLRAEQYTTDDWLLWQRIETQLPYSSSFTTFPPINLYANQGTLFGSIAIPYSISNNASTINDFLIVVEDADANTHVIKPSLNAVGFVSEVGVGLATFSSNAFQNGDVVIFLYKANSPDNRQELQSIASKELERNQQIESELANINIPKPVTGETWQLSGTTLDGQGLNNLINLPIYTIIQLYSPHCGFCAKAVPFMNALDKSDEFRVIGLSGVENIEGLKQHLITNNVQYSFIAYEGEYAESAVLKATDQEGFPTFVVLDRAKIVLEILVGQPALERWLALQIKE